MRYLLVCLLIFATSAAMTQKKGKVIKTNYWAEGLYVVKDGKQKNLEDAHGNVIATDFKDLDIESPYVLITTGHGTLVYEQRNLLFELPTGEILMDLSYKGVFVVLDNKNYYVINLAGKKISDSYAETFGFDRKGYMLAKTDDIWFAYDTAMKEVHRFDDEFDQMNQLHRGGKYELYSSDRPKERYFTRSPCFRLINAYHPMEKFDDDSYFMTVGYKDKKMAIYQWSQYCNSDSLYPAELSKPTEATYMYLLTERDGHPVVVSYETEEPIFWDLAVDEIIPLKSTKKDDWYIDEATEFIIHDKGKYGIGSVYDNYNDSLLATRMLYDRLEYIPGSFYQLDGMGGHYKIYSESNKQGIISFYDTVVPPIYDAAELIPPVLDEYSMLMYYYVSDNGKKGVYESHYKADSLLIPIIYDDIFTSFNNEEEVFLIVQEGDEYGLYYTDYAIGFISPVIEPGFTKKPTPKFLSGGEVIPYRKDGELKYALMQYGPKVMLFDSEADALNQMDY